MDKPRLTSRSIEDLLPTGNLANRELQSHIDVVRLGQRLFDPTTPQLPFWPTRPECGCISVQCLVIEWPAFGRLADSRLFGIAIEPVEAVRFAEAIAAEPVEAVRLADAISSFSSLILLSALSPPFKIQAEPTI